MTKMIPDVENKLRKIIFDQVLKSEKVTDYSCSTSVTHKLHKMFLRSIAAQIKQGRERRQQKTIEKEVLFVFFFLLAICNSTTI